MITAFWLAVCEGRGCVGTEVAITSSDDKAEKLKKLGVDHII